MALRTWFTEALNWNGSSYTYTYPHNHISRLLAFELDLSADPGDITIKIVRSTGSIHTIATFDVGAAEKYYTSDISGGEWLANLIIMPGDVLHLLDDAGSSTGTVFLTLQPVDTR